MKGKILDYNIQESTGIISVMMVKDIVFQTMNGKQVKAQKQIKMLILK